MMVMHAVYLQLRWSLRFTGWSGSMSVDRCLIFWAVFPQVTCACSTAVGAGCLLQHARERFEPNITTHDFSHGHAWRCYKGHTLKICHSFLCRDTWCLVICSHVSIALCTGEAIMQLDVSRSKPLRELSPRLGDNPCPNDLTVGAAVYCAINIATRGGYLMPQLPPFEPPL